MRTMRLMMWITIVCLIMSADIAKADMRLHLSRRELSMRAEVIVIVKAPEPLHPWSEKGIMRAKGPEKAVKFRVLEVIKGEGIKTADTISVNGLSEYTLERAYWRVSGRRKAPLPEITKGLFFLQSDKDAEEEGTYQLEATGIRYLTEKNEVLYPLQKCNPGPWALTLAQDTKWDEVVEKIRFDLSVLEDVTALKRIEDPVQRNKALFDWIESNKKKLCEYAKVKTHDMSWSTLEEWVFEWIMESCIPEDCWRALKLYTEIVPKSFRGPTVELPCFASSEGRKLLVAIAIDERMPDSDRICALRWLRCGTFEPYSRKKLPEHLVMVTVDEQKEILEKLIPLLESENSQIREAVVESVRDLSNPTQGSMPEFDVKYALPSLVDAYDAEKPGKIRNKMAVAVRAVGGDKYWNELTGNPFGLVVLLDGLRVSDKNATFSLHLSFASVEIPECPTMILELIGDMGKIIEKKSMPFPLFYPKKEWKEITTRGIYGAAILFDGLAIGQWRITVKGKCKSVREKLEGEWISEAEIFIVPELKKEPDNTTKQLQPEKK